MMIKSGNLRKREFFFVCAAVFLLVFGAYISGTLLVPFAKSLGGTSLSIGLVYSSMYVVRLLLGAPIGRLSERRGAKTILRWSLMLYPLIAAAYWISWDISSLIAARLLHGIASAMMLPMAMAYIGEASPSGKEGRYMGIYNTILFTASAAGPFFGGVIYESFGIRNAFFALFVLAVVSLAVMLVSVRGGGPPRKADEHKKKKGGSLQLLKDRRLAALCCLYIATAILLALMGASFTQLALFYGLGMGEIGLLIALFNAVIGIVQIPLGHFADRRDKIRLTAVSGAAASAVMLLFPLVRGAAALAAVTVLLGALAAMNLASATALSAVLGREAGMGKTMGFLASSSSAGTIAGYLGLGWITDAAGIESAFYSAGAVLFAGTAAFLLLWRKSTAVCRDKKEL